MPTLLSIFSSRNGEQVLSAGTAERRMYWLQQLQKARREFSHNNLNRHSTQVQVNTDGDPCKFDRPWKRNKHAPFFHKIVKFCLNLKVCFVASNFDNSIHYLFVASSLFSLASLFIMQSTCNSQMKKDTKSFVPQKEHK